MKKKTKKEISNTLALCGTPIAAPKHSPSNDKHFFVSWFRAKPVICSGVSGCSKLLIKQPIKDQMSKPEERSCWE